MITNKSGRKPKPKPVREAGRPRQPETLTGPAADKWGDMVRLLDEGNMLASLDGDALELYCRLWARYQEAERKIAEEGSVYTTPSGYQRPNPYVKIATDLLKDLKTLLIEFGLTPASRKRVDTASEPLDPLQAFLREGYAERATPSDEDDEDDSEEDEAQDDSPSTLDVYNGPAYNAEPYGEYWPASPYG